MDKLDAMKINIFFLNFAYKGIGWNVLATTNKTDCLCYIASWLLLFLLLFIIAIGMDTQIGSFNYFKTILQCFLQCQ